MKMNSYAFYPHWSGLETRYACHDLNNYYSQMITELESILPHGSGINSDWSFDIQQNGLIVCSNIYDAMDQYGRYCHYWNFSIKIKPTLNNPDFMVRYIDSPFSFEYVSFSFKGQKEYSCCGYGLKDYLEDCFFMFD